DRERRYSDELEARDQIEQLALGRGRERAADLVERALERVREGKQAQLGGPTPERDEQRGFARREVERRKGVSAVERVAAAAAAFGVERKRGVAERFEIPVDGAHRHAEAIGQFLGGDATAPGAQKVGDGK